MPTFNFTTGPSTLPDVGLLSYNGCKFSPLFETQVSAVFVQDDAKRTTKEIEYAITVDGYVTLPDGATNVETTLDTMVKLLNAPAGALYYTGRGKKIVVNAAGGLKDVAWGPVPEILDITPMGGGRSCKVKWTVKTRVPATLRAASHTGSEVLQFCFDTSVSYGEDGYSSLRITGITEVPLTRATAADRSVPSSADEFRARFPGILLETIDKSVFRVTRRDFKLSRDKRTLEFDVVAEELPPMAMPPYMLARGMFTFKPAKAGVGLCNWLCTLTCTYTVPRRTADNTANVPRNTAWYAFLALLRVRMNDGNTNGVLPAPGGNQNPGPAAIAALAGVANPGAIGAQGIIIALWRRIFADRFNPNQRKVFLIELTGSEGVHLDSKTVTFSATWRLVTVFSRILQASGLWRQVPGVTSNLWAASVRDIQGYKSWLDNEFEARLDAIVDFGF